LSAFIYMVSFLVSFMQQIGNYITNVIPNPLRIYIFPSILLNVPSGFTIIVGLLSCHVPFLSIIKAGI
jgi:hypothetical protein